MKRNRILLLILWVLSLVGISFYGGVVSYGLFFFFTLIPIVSLLYLLLVLSFFKIYQNPKDRNLVAGRPGTFYFTLQNESLLTFSGIRVLFYSSFSKISLLSDETEYELGPRSGIKKKTRILCHYRGEYEVGIKTIVITDFFKLFRFTYQNREPFQVVVKPAIISVTRLRSTDSVPDSSTDAPRPKSEPDILLREYVPGDDVRLINWKVTGRLQKPMVRQLTGTANEGVGIIMDSSRLSPSIHQYLPVENKVLEICLALNLHFSNARIPVTNYYSDHGFQEAVVDKERFEGFYQNLCGFRFSEENPLDLLCADALSQSGIYTKKAVFMILQQLSIATGEAALQLMSRGIPVIVYLVCGDDNGSEMGKEQQIHRGKIVKIPPDADLREVL